jgi:hypothetical protein
MWCQFSHDDPLILGEPKHRSPAGMHGPGGFRSWFNHFGPPTLTQRPNLQFCDWDSPSNLRTTVQILHEKEFEFKRDGNEVYRTNSLILLAKNMLCSKLHRQKVLIKFPFYIKFDPSPGWISNLRLANLVFPWGLVGGSGATSVRLVAYSQVDNPRLRYRGTLPIRTPPPTPLGP